MERWKRKNKGLPKGWHVEDVPIDLFNQWMEAPGVEEELRHDMQLVGLPEDAQVVVVSGEEELGKSSIWFHPVAAFGFARWLSSRVWKGDIAPRFGVLYAAIYDNGLTKVGMSYASYGESRLAQHDSVMDLTGARPVEHIVIECKAHPKGAEKMLIEEMAARYKQKRKEWFFDVDPDVAREVMADCIERDWHKKCQSAKVSA